MAKVYLATASTATPGLKLFDTETQSISHVSSYYGGSVFVFGNIIISGARQTSGNTIYVSKNAGSSWMEKVIPAGNRQLRRIDCAACSGSRIVIHDTSNRVIAFSDDSGDSWQTSYNTSNYFRDMTFFKGKYFALHINGYLAKSNNGVTGWESVLSGPFGAGICTIHATNDVMVFHDFTNLYYSTDGETFHSVVGITSKYGWCISNNGNSWLAIAPLIRATSLDGISWVVETDSSFYISPYLKGSSLDGNHVAVLYGNGLVQSSDGDFWSYISPDLSAWEPASFNGFAVAIYVPPSPNHFGADFDGFDRGTSVEIDRNILVVDTLGGPPRLIERGPASGALDRWRVSTTLAVPWDKAQALQAAAPPYGTDTTAVIALPPRGGASSFPGLGPATAASSSDTYAGVALRSLESKGQMGVRVDLYGYGVEFDLFCTTTGGYAVNSATAPTTTVPAFIARKFRAHQLNDASRTQYAVSGGGVLAATSSKVKAGRRKDLNVALDYLSPDEADQLVAFFRGVRTATVTLPFDSDGRPGSGSFVLTGLSFQRQALFWDAKLEVSAA